MQNVKMNATQKRVAFFILKGGFKMNVPVVEITPDKDGRLFVTFYGTTYEIKVKENKKPTKDNK